jgi:hypothetical protein
MNKTSDLIEELEDDLFHEGRAASFAKQSNSYALPGVKHSSEKAASHYAYSYRRFTKRLEAEQDERAYLRLAEMESKLAERIAESQELAQEAWENFEKLQRQLDALRKKDSIDDLFHSNSESLWHGEEVDAIENLPDVDPPAAVLLKRSQDEDEPEYALVVYLSEEVGYTGPYPSPTLSSLKEIVSNSLSSAAEKYERELRKTSITEITRDALEDVLFRYEVSGSTSSLPTLDIDREKQDGETSSPGRDNNLTDEELANCIEKLEEKTGKRGENMSYRGLAEALLEDLDISIPYAKKSLRKRISRFYDD